jgi:hypothetical protein
MDAQVQNPPQVLPIPEEEAVEEELTQTREWAQMAAAGEAATKAARASLHEKGIYPVYLKDGVLVEELPDGSTRPVRRQGQQD